MIIQDMSLPGLPLFQHEAMYKTRQKQHKKLDSAPDF